MKLVALALLLAGCCPDQAPQVRCDDHGRIVMSGLTDQQQVAALQANIRLNTLRLQALDDRWIDPAQLVKAKGCP